MRVFWLFDVFFCHFRHRIGVVLESVDVHGAVTADLYLAGDGFDGVVHENGDANSISR